MTNENKKTKILIAEDEKPMANALKLKLEKEGYQVKTVNNGLDALNSLAAEEFDLIILDLLMPEMDGFAVLDGLNQRNLKIPVIAASNLGQNEDIQRAKELGAEHYFVKANTSLAQIVEKIKSIIQ